ncbi:F0F1 ATP synthase subunit A [Herpetosiphon giganteus]|uniref:F0F1 ATP synthase subunit A n=1 Tax=Herpetosiphon giganteus TaxID=2029754 RepID=UPI0019573B66|nr:F0F1 ATP synthase subunit A [Herpetosiphon giganteus]MBM7844010.1 F-type H+-transporting ATPase subunit a [Herpetosiphon giganteus]
MSTKQKVIIAVAITAVIGIALRIFLPVGTPLVSVRAEELFHIGGYTITNSLLLTWIVMALLIVLAVVGTSKLRSGNAEALKQPRGLQNALEYAVEMFYNTMQGVSPKFAGRFFVIVATIFFLVLPSNWFGLIPGVGSIGLCYSHSAEHAAAPNYVATAGISTDTAAPVLAAAAEGGKYTHNCPSGTAFHPFLRPGSADLNMTLALALISFAVTEFWGFRSLGFGYLGKFFNFRGGLIQAAVGIIELISEFARIVSFAFRLFGNIFAGEVVLLVMAFLFPTLLSLPFYGLELFVGLIQAFVFAMLTMAFIDMAAESHGDHGHEEHAH